MRAALVAEPAIPVATALRRFLESAGYAVIVVGSAAEALREVRNTPPEVLLTSLSPSLDGEALCREVKQEAPELPVLVLYMPEEENPEERATAAGADACLVGPLKRTTLVTCVGLMLQVAEARAAARSTKAPAAPQPESDDAAARRFGLEGPSSPDFDFLKRLLLMEVKRSRRYRYPIALLLMELDHLGERTAHLVTGKLLDYIEFDDGFAIVKMAPPKETHNFTLQQAGVRSRYGITIVGVKRPGADFTYAIPSTKVHPDDTLIVSGHVDQIEAFAARP